MSFCMGHLSFVDDHSGNILWYYMHFRMMILDLCCLSRSLSSRANEDGMTQLDHHVIIPFVTVIFSLSIDLCLDEMDVHQYF